MDLKNLFSYSFYVCDFLKYFVVFIFVIFFNTGLDPAGLNFIKMGPIVRLDPSDANFVDNYHTAAGLLGRISTIVQFNIIDIITVDY